MLTSRSFRSLILGAAQSLGAASLFGLAGPRILLYHGVTSERDRGIFNYRKKFIDTAVFRAHLTWIKEQYEVLPLADFLRAHNAGSLSSRPMAITFDDGYANNYTDAFPALRELSLPATFFITTGF